MLLAKMFAGRDVYYEEVTLRFMYGRLCRMGCGGQAAALRVRLRSKWQNN